jgi:hypothetical protein
MAPLRISEVEAILEKLKERYSKVDTNISSKTSNSEFFLYRIENENITSEQNLQGQFSFLFDGDNLQLFGLCTLNFV